jgi:hypothetical protein
MEGEWTRARLLRAGRERALGHRVLAQLLCVCVTVGQSGKTNDGVVRASVRAQAAALDAPPGAHAARPHAAAAATGA